MKQLSETQQSSKHTESFQMLLNHFNEANRRVARTNESKKKKKLHSHDATRALLIATFSNTQFKQEDLELILNDQISALRIIVNQNLLDVSEDEDCFNPSLSLHHDLEKIIAGVLEIKDEIAMDKSLIASDRMKKVRLLLEATDSIGKGLLAANSALKGKDQADLKTFFSHTSRILTLADEFDRQDPHVSASDRRLGCTMKGIGLTLAGIGLALFVVGVTGAVPSFGTSLGLAFAGGILLVVGGLMARYGFETSANNKPSSLVRHLRFFKNELCEEVTNRKENNWENPILKI